MHHIWVERTIEAPAHVVWRLLTATDDWPAWGPSVRGAVIDGGAVVSGATGTVETIGGVRVPFEITDVVDGHSWSWDVAGFGATDHRVVALGPLRCRAGVGVPWPAAPYAAVCAIALRRLEALATDPARSR